MSTLARQQRWFYDAVVADAAPAKPERHLGSTAVAPRIGLSVYRHAYGARLLEALTDDFTAVATVVGEQAFARLVAAFIRAHPPQDATLNAYGRFFAPWLAKKARIGKRAQLTELAHLEWALVEAIHAPLAPALNGTDLATVAAHAWGRIRLRPAPSLRLVPCRFNANTVYEAFRQGRALPAWRRQPGSVAVLRKPDGLSRIELTANETGVLARLIAGKPLAEALDGLAARNLPDVQQSFTRWVTHGVFTALV